jgi:hypothetical protein
MFVLLFATTLFAFVFAALQPLLRHAPVILALAVDWSPLVKAVMEGAQALLALVFPLLAALIAQSIRAKLKSARARELFDRVYEFVETEVRALMQSTLPEVRAAMADGKITPEEAQRLRQIVIERVRVTLGAGSLAQLQVLLADRDVNSYLASVIESKVLQVKTDAPRLLEARAYAAGEVLT